MKNDNKINKDLECLSQVVSKLSKDFTNFATESYVQDNFISKNNITYGSESFVFNGIQTSFTIPHGLDQIPISISLTFSDGANQEFIQSNRAMTDEFIVITCDSAPVGEMTVFWQAFK